LTTWHCILSAKLTKSALLQTVFLAILRYIYSLIFIFLSLLKYS